MEEVHWVENLQDVVVVVDGEVGVVRVVDDVFPGKLP